MKACFMGPGYIGLPTAIIVAKHEIYTKGKGSRTAEMCKLTENSCRDPQIAFANELSIICDKAGINVWELKELANKCLQVNILQPGCGVESHCIAVGPYFISSKFPQESRICVPHRLHILPQTIVERQEGHSQLLRHLQEIA